MIQKTETFKLFNDDCFNVMENIPDKAFDISFTSPPYNRKRNDKYSFYNDCIDDYFLFLKTSVSEMIRVTKGLVFLNIQKNFYNKIDVFKLIGEFHKHICEVFIWEKSNPMPASGFSITNAYEFVIVFGDKIKSNRTYTKNHITTSVTRMHKNHKAVMNNKISDFFIKNFSKEKDIIFDPFMGTGTTGISALNLNRKFVGVELIREYFEYAQTNIKCFQRECE